MGQERPLVPWSGPPTPPLIAGSTWGNSRSHWPAVECRIRRMFPRQTSARCLAPQVQQKIESFVTGIRLRPRERSGGTATLLSLRPGWRRFA